MNKIKIDENVAHFKVALNMAKISLEEGTADLILNLVELVNTKKGEGTIEDVINIKHKIEEKYNYVTCQFTANIDTNTEIVNELINKEYINSNKINDGHHTISEIYEFRKLYHALWINSLTAEEIKKYNVHKSIKHNDGEYCFGGGWFIVVVELPTGVISNHYKTKDWHLFKIPAKDNSTTIFDGHTSQDVKNRILEYIKTSL